MGDIRTMQKDIQALRKLESEATPSRRLRPMKPPTPPAVPPFKKPARLPTPSPIQPMPSSARPTPPPIRPQEPAPLPIIPREIRPSEPPIKEMEAISTPPPLPPFEPRPVKEPSLPSEPEKPVEFAAERPSAPAMPSVPTRPTPSQARPTPPPIRPRTAPAPLPVEAPTYRPPTIAEEVVPLPPPARPSEFISPVPPSPEIIPQPEEPIMRPSGLERPQEIPIEEKPAIVPEAPSVPERPVVMPSVEPMAARPATYPRRPVMPPQPIRPKAEIPHLQVPMPSREREPAGFTPLRFRNLEEESAPIFVKIAAIFLIMLFLAGIGSFTYWFFFIKERPQPPVCAQVITPAINPKTGECKDFATPCAVPKEWEPVDACEGPLPPPPPPPIVEPEPPQSLIPEANLAKTKTIAITSKDELAPALAKAVEENYTSGKFTRILIKPDETTLHDVGEAYITLQHFFDFMGISIPENVLSKLNQEYTLFARPQKEGNRLGLAVKIKTKSGLWEAMKAWEPKMISDWDSLFRIWVVYKQAPEYSPKEVSWQGVPLRYIAYMPGLGINYAISGDYLFFTTSGDSIHALIESLK